MSSVQNRNPLDGYVSISKLIYQLKNGRVILERIDSIIENSIRNPIVINNSSENSDENETKRLLNTSENIDENETKEEVILEKSRLMVNNSIKNPTVINKCTSKTSDENETKDEDVFKNSKPATRNSSRNSIAINNFSSKSNNADESSDEFFFQEPEKKTALRISNPYCSKCNKTVDNVKRTEKNCPECGTLLLYKCMKCNRQYSNYSSIAYHARNCYFSTKRYSCSKCDYSTPVRFLMSKHSKTHKSLKLCTKCGNKFTYIMKHKRVCIKNKAAINNDNKASDEFTDLSIESSKRKKSIDSLYSIKKNNISKEDNAINIRHFCKSCNTVKMHRNQSRLGNCEKCGENLFCQCWKCRKLYATYKGLKYHFESQCEPEASYDCLKCDYKTTIHSLIRRHISRMHRKNNSNEPRQQCPKCHNFYKNADVIKQHIRFCGKEPNYFCTNCPYKTVYRQNLRSHLNFAHKELTERTKGKIIETNANNIKEENGKSSNLFKIMILQNKENSDFIKYQCLHCDKAVNLKSSAKNCPKCQTLLVLQCKKCSKTCSTFHGLLNHIGKMHNVKLSINSLKCIKCNKDDFQNRTSFFQHMKYCQEPKHLQCKQCSFKTHYKSNLTSHLKQAHSNSNSKSILKEKNTNKLPQQSNSSQRHGKVQQNKETTDSVRSYCSKCNEMKLTNRTVKCRTCYTILTFECVNCNKNNCIHVKKYKKKWKFSCSTCIKAFDSHVYLRIHKRYCTSKANFNCKFCSFKSKFKTSTLRHENTFHRK